MANTTDLMITVFDEETAAINFINKETQLDFKKYSVPAKCGGTKVVIFEVYGTCQRCIGEERIDMLITAFKKAPFSFPEWAILFIDDDNGAYSGTVTFNT